MSIEVRGLRKAFGAVQAVCGVDLDVPTGSLFAFVGRNGAGKSTTIGCLTTTISPDAGELTIDGSRVGRDDGRIRERIGVVFQNSALDGLLSVRENIALRAGFYGIRGSELDRRIDDVVALVQLSEFADRRYGALSGGQRRRADIARALVHRPAILFLDEPTAGLDPQSRQQLWTAIRTLRQEHDLTVFLTTHYMEETEQADRVCIIDSGSVVAEGDPAGLRRDHSSSVLSLVVSPGADVDARIAAAGGRVLPGAATGMLRVAVADSAVARTILASLADDAVDFEFRHGTMDDVFLAVTGRAAEDAA